MRSPSASCQKARPSSRRRTTRPTWWTRVSLRSGERADRLARPLAHREHALGPLLALAVDDRLAPPVVDEEALVGATPLEPAASLVGHQDLVHDVVTVALAVAVDDGGAGADRLPEQD